MSPRKPVKALYDLSLEIVIRSLRKYLERKVEKINFFNDFTAAAQEFLSRCGDGKDFIADHFIGPLRWISRLLIGPASIILVSHWSRDS